MGGPMVAQSFPFLYLERLNRPQRTMRMVLQFWHLHIHLCSPTPSRILRLFHEQFYARTPDPLQLMHCRACQDADTPARTCTVQVAQAGGAG